MPEISYYGALLAGLLSFLTPCVLPMVPFYLSYLAGISMAELHDTEEMSAGCRKRIFVATIAFALGVTTIFVLLGLGATAAGTALAQWRTELSWAAAAVLLVFGVHFIGLLRIPLLYREARLATAIKPSNLLGAYAMGLAFGFGWTPCVGPALAAVLFVAGGMDDVWRGGALLFAYGIGMTLPFVLASAFVGPFLAWVQRHRSKLRFVEVLLGAVLLLFAVLIATDSVANIANWMLATFPAFQLFL